MTDEVLRTENLARAFGGLQAVAGVSLSLYAGKVTALVGPNGAGKTSLLRAIAGTLPVSGGQIDLGGLKRRDIGYLPQQAALDRGFPISVLDTVLLGGVGAAIFFLAATIPNQPT